MIAPRRRLPAPEVAAGDYEDGAERLLAQIALACEPAASFPQRLEAALRATLTLFAAEPELGLLLTDQPPATDELALCRHRRWQRRFADLLRAAADESPVAHVHPPFVEPAVIDGIRWQISRRLHADGPERLADLLPGLLEFVLVYYFDPERAAVLAPSETR